MSNSKSSVSSFRGGAAGFLGELSIPDTVHQIAVPVTLNEWNDLENVPKVVIAAPGAGLTIQVVSWGVKIHYGSAALTGGGNVHLTYGDGQWNAPLAFGLRILPQDLQNANVSHFIVPSSAPNTNQNNAITANAAVYLWTDGTFATGTGSSFTVYITYVLV
jgi:hypothetical protein